MRVGHSFANKCEVDFVSIENDKIMELIKQNRAFHESILHNGLYPGIADDQTTVKVSR